MTEHPPKFEGFRFIGDKEPGSSTTTTPTTAPPAATGGFSQGIDAMMPPAP